MTASTRPHARLQPSAAISTVRTSSWPAVAIEREPTIVTAISRPNRISEIRSIGSSRRFDSVVKLSSCDVVIGGAYADGASVSSRCTMPPSLRLRIGRPVRSNTRSIDGFSASTSASKTAMPR